MDDEMIERCAKAAWEVRRQKAAHLNIILEEWGDGSIPKANHIIDEVKTIINVMREPTEKMIELGNKHTDWADGADEAWRAMIDSIINT